MQHILIKNGRRVERHYDLLMIHILMGFTPAPPGYRIVVCV